MLQEIIDLLAGGAEANRQDKFRRGNVITLLAEGTLIATGDLHGHRRNFERISAFADLPHNPDRHLVLQEIIHGGSEDCQGRCLSYKLLFDVVRYKLSFPDQVHLVMGNHDTAFINNTNVIKDGKEMNRAMLSALDRQFGPDSDDVKLAMRQFLFSQPLAVRTENRIWLSHSLPGNSNVDKFDSQIMNRQLKVSDTVRPGPVYTLTWGRNHSRQTLDRMAELLDVDIFILGHQPQQHGWKKAGENLIIIASDHNHGCLLPIELAKSYTVEQLAEAPVSLASIS